MKRARGPAQSRHFDDAWSKDVSLGNVAPRLWTEGHGKRKQTYVAQLSREALSKLRRKHRTAEALAAAWAEWIAEREREKGGA